MGEIRVRTTRTALDRLETPLLAVQVFERESEPQGVLAELDSVYGGTIRRVLTGGDFTGRKDDTLVIYPAAEGAPVRRVLLIGVGKREDYIVERMRRAVGLAVRQAEKLGVGELALHLGHRHRLSEHLGGYYSALSATESAVLAAWDFREFKTKPDEESERSLDTVTLVADTEEEEADYREACEHGRIIASAANLARELAVRPGNSATPTFLAEVAQRLGREHDFRVRALDRDAIRKEGMHALLAVNQGSDEEPRFIVMEYEGGEGAPVVLVGKAVTFDTGGISMKPAQSMEDMKYDMSGGAAVIAAMGAIAQLKLKINVVGLVPATDNMPSGRALKPGDVIGSLDGKTIEVINTDAEGRLILADALAFARRLNPAAIVDAATLTGSCVIALGHQAIGLMGNHGPLIDQVRGAGMRVGERCWPLPLWDEYREQLDSQVADLKNVGGRAAGTITAGWFLKEFVGEVPWAHLDIAGTAYREEAAPYLRKGPTGVPTRLFIEWVRKRAGR
jgi:leucyl aminopeptidase